MAKKKILLIEDDKSLVKIIKETLEPKDFDVILAIDADEGIEKATLEKPDLIVLDVLLPGRNGFECLEELKSKKETKRTPVIILSNLGQVEEIRRGKELGAVDYAVKADFTIDQVIDKILAHL
jgi:DNA-binding response OmpR family regulator